MKEGLNGAVSKPAGVNPLHSRAKRTKAELNLDALKHIPGVVDLLKNTEEAIAAVRQREEARAKAAQQDNEKAQLEKA